MPYRKAEYEANGHDVTIQQVNEGGSPSAWIDGYAAHTNLVFESDVFDEIKPDAHRERIEYLREEGEDWDSMKALLAWMCECHVYYCKKCDSFYPSDDVSQTGFAGHICGDCARDKAHCPDNPDSNSHEDECLNPRQRHNARMPTKFKCVHCGRKRQTVPTG